MVHHTWMLRWLQLGVLSLALSGIFSIILVISRTPQLIKLVPWLGELFSVSLVVHVDLSVLVWFLSMLGLQWAWLHQAHAAKAPPLFRGAAIAMTLLGMVLMAASPLSGEWLVHKSNYIPVLVNALFFLGLGLVAAGMVIAMLVLLPLRVSLRDDPLNIGIYLSVWIIVMAFGCFVASAYAMPLGITGLAFYEHVFWAGGHVLQYAYVQSMLVAWLWCAPLIGLPLPPRRMVLALLVIQPLLVLLAPLGFRHEVFTQEHLNFFTQHMNWGLGIAGGALSLWLVWHWLRLRPNCHEAVAGSMKMSLMLFAVGGVFGLLIDGPNVKIPAHYHGSIVAVTLALMGMAYSLLPQFGYADVRRWRLARWQPYLYGFGQLLHISGLAWSGGYGVLRKAVGDTGEGGWHVKAALGMMGGGGLLAILGGLFFVIVCTKVFLRGRVSTDETGACATPKLMG